MNIMSNTNDTTASASSSPSWDSNVNYIGFVKWFNNKAGYGFLTVMDGEKKEEDIFCHHSGINVKSEQYKYLVQGEYVAFSLRESDSNTHPYQAGEIRGVCDGKLMCETRWENRQARESQGDGDGDGGQERGRGGDRGGYRQNRSQGRSNPRGGGPRDSRQREDGATWMLVRTDENGNSRPSGGRRDQNSNRRHHNNESRE